MALIRVSIVFLSCLFLVQCGEGDGSSAGNGNDLIDDGDEPITLAEFSLSTGYSHSCVSSKALETAYCWGSGSNSKLGLDDVEDKEVPTPVSEDLQLGSGDSIDSVSAGDDHTCYLQEESEQVICVGSQEGGGLGNGETQGDSSSAVFVSSGMNDSQPLGGVQELSSMGAHTCARVKVEAAPDVTPTMEARCWGNNQFGQLGNDGLIGSAVPVKVSNPVNVTEPLVDVAQVTAGFTHSCALMGSSGVLCWGDNDNGQLGDGGTGGNSPRPIIVLSEIAIPLTGIVEVKAGMDFTCAIKGTTSGEVWCWGAGPRLGNNAVSDQVAQSFPVQVVVRGEEGVSPTPLVDTTGLSLGHFHACAVRSDLSGVCWGDNQDGQVGINDFAPHQGAAVAIHQGVGNTEPLVGFVEISAGHNFTCGILKKGELKCWGNGANGILGNGRSVDDHSIAPVDILGEDGEVFVLPEEGVPEV